MNAILFGQLKVGEEFKNNPDDTHTYIKVSHRKGVRVEDVNWTDDFAVQEPVYVDYQ